jgi:hypothetical protein
MARIENHKFTIDEAFRECFYIVPDYQREYPRMTVLEPSGAASSSPQAHIQSIVEHTFHIVVKELWA